MPNIKSAKKRVLVIKKKTLINQMHKTALKTAIRKFNEAVEANNVDEVILQLRREKLRDSINNFHVNSDYYPNVKLFKNI